MAYPQKIIDDFRKNTYLIKEAYAYPIISTIFEWQIMFLFHCDPKSLFLSIIQYKYKISLVSDKTF